MNIYIPQIAIVLLIIVVSNFFISFGESNLMKKSYILVSSILSVMGISGIITLRPLLISKLNNNMDNGRLDAEFVEWAVTRFDNFGFISIIVTCLAIILFLCLLVLNRKNKDSVVWKSTSLLVNSFRIIILIFMICYSFGIINKRFDLASYVLTLSVCEIFALYIPLAAKKIFMLKE